MICETENVTVGVQLAVSASSRPRVRRGAAPAKVAEALQLVVLFVFAQAKPLRWSRNTLRQGLLLLCALCSLVCASYAMEIVPTPSSIELQDWSLNQLEDRLGEIDGRLSSLAQMTLRTGEGAIGYRSSRHTKADTPEWIEIDLQAEHRIDQIVLIPVTLRDFQRGYVSDAFPQKFRILAGTENDSEGSIIAEFDAANSATPDIGIAPLILPVEPTLASWVRLEATQLSAREYDGHYALELSELLIFSGETNVALHKPVRTPPPPNALDKRLLASWSSPYLVDGNVPYLMNSSSGSSSISYLSGPILRRTKGATLPAVLKVDLGAAYPLSRIHLHTIDGGNTVPHSNTDGVGTPPDFTIEGANKRNFSDAQVLVHYTKSRSSTDGPIMMWNIPETNCRYVRLITPRISPKSENDQIGFAEIELIAAEQNVVRGKSFKANSMLKPASKVRTLNALTDGKNRFGHILPIRDWLEQLAERHRLESERPLILAEIGQRYAQQKLNLRIMTWMLAAAFGAICITILIGRNIRIKQAAQIKERFAADLHDELGANLHTISLLSDLARDSVDERDELIELLDEMRVMSEQSGQAARYCTNMLEAEELCQNLKDEIERTSRRLLSDIDYQLKITGEAELASLRTRRRIDLYLFYKETLINIIRHSNATSVCIDIAASKKSVQFIIQDNGIGTGQIPPSLARRARLLKADIKAETPDAGGTSITLSLKRTKKPI
ncbi:MAG: histidine kinase [Opitutaceae bacterium]